MDRMEIDQPHLHQPMPPQSSPQRMLPPGAGYANLNAPPPAPPSFTSTAAAVSGWPSQHQQQPSTSSSTSASLAPQLAAPTGTRSSFEGSNHSQPPPTTTSTTRRPSLPQPPSSPPLQPTSSMTRRSPLPTPPSSTLSPPPTATTVLTQSPTSSAESLPSPSASAPPLQFSPIPPSFTTSTPPTAPPQQVHQVYTSLPSFVPAPAFSKDDLGPYPPLLTRKRESGAMAKKRRDSGDKNVPGSGMPGSPRSKRSGSVPSPTLSQQPPPSQQLRPPPSQQPPIGIMAEPSEEKEEILPPPNPIPSTSNAYPTPSPSSSPQPDLQNLTGIGLRNSLVLRPASYPLPSTSTFPNQVPSSPQFAPQPQPQPQPQLAPHLTPQPEICVECMMRDRDMIDVDVTSPGIWDRESDVDLLEGEDWTGSAMNGGSSEGSSGWEGRDSGGRERERKGKGQALTGQALKLWTSMNPPAAAHRWRTLQSFLATQAHLIDLERQAREQTAFEVEEHARRFRSSSSSVPPPSSSNLNSSSNSTGLGFPSSSSTRNRSSTTLPNGLIVETVRVDKDEKKRRESNSNSLSGSYKRGKSKVRVGGGDGSDDEDDLPRRYASGDQPWLSSPGGPRRPSYGRDRDSVLSVGGAGGGATRPTSPSSVNSRSFGFGRFVSGARSSIDLRSLSPSRASVDDRRPSSSLWSKFRQSGSQSVYSFAPSGSMMDMHLGLSMDKHQQNVGLAGLGGYGAPYETYGGNNSASDSAVQRLNRGVMEEDGGEEGRRRREEGEGGEKKRKKGFKGFLSKLIGTKDGSTKSGGGGGGDPYYKHGISASAPTTPYLDPSFPNFSTSRNRRPSPTFTTSDEFLAPPPPLSALVNEPRYHARSGSSSSLDSLQQPPFTPPLYHPSHASPNFGRTVSDSYPRSPGVGDRGSVLTTGSYSSARSGGGGQRSLRPSMDYLGPEGNSPPRGSGMSGVMASAAEEEVICSSEVGGGGGGLRKEKSLPSLPSEAHGDYPQHLQHLQRHPQQPYPPLHQSPYGASHGNRETRSAYSIRTPSLSPTVSRSYFEEETSTLGGGRKSRAKSKVFSMNFGGAFNRNGGGKSRASEEEKREKEERTKVKDQALKGIQREGALVSVRF